MKKGKLITVYGINNIGKSTQVKLMVENLRKSGFEVVSIKYPVYDLKPSGVYLHGLLRDSNEQSVSEHELQIWFTLNRHQFEEQLKEWLNEGKIVVAEDYIGTGLAWGSAKGANLEWLENLNKYLIKEDLAIFLKGKRNIHAKENIHIHENNDDLVEACQFIMENLAKKYGWKTISVKTSIGETSNEIWGIVEEFLSEVKKGGVKEKGKKAIRK